MQHELADFLKNKNPLDVILWNRGHILSVWCQSHHSFLNTGILCIPTTSNIIIMKYRSDERKLSKMKSQKGLSTGPEVHLTWHSLTVLSFQPRWGILFSHPRDYTPVCTTELGRAARLHEEFSKRGVKMIALSVDCLEDHHSWTKVWCLQHMLPH